MKRIFLFVIAGCLVLSLAGCAVGADAGMDGVSVSAGPDGSMDFNGNLDRDLADDGIVNNTPNVTAPNGRNANNDLDTDSNLNTNDDVRVTDRDSNVTDHNKHTTTTSPDGVVS